MSESISAFDGNYVRLGRVAALVAQERQQCIFDDVMDLLKQAVFAGKFDPPSFEVGETRRDACCQQTKPHYRSVQNSSTASIAARSQVSCSRPTGSRA
jgi:hypothetical protein